MVVRRRSALMAVVACSALALALAFFWRMRTDAGVVPFLVGCGLVVVAAVHAAAWRASRSPVFVADLSSVQVRLGRTSVTLPWADVATVEVALRRRFGDGRICVHARDERRALTGLPAAARLAVLVNRWLYDVPLAVPYGLTTAVSTPDVVAELERLGDGRVDVVLRDGSEPEPVPTVEVAPPGTLTRSTAPGPAGDDEEAAAPAHEPSGESTVPAHPRRLAAAVSALRTAGARREPGRATAPLAPATVGTLALSNLAEPAALAALPEAEELRRRPPESDPESLVVVQTPVPAKAEADWLRPPGRGFDYLVERPSPAAGLPAAQEIGERVRAAREWLDVTVDELADRTMIRPFVIESIEAGDLSACGGDVYARGHLRMLAGTLGIDAEPLLRRYDDELASGPVDPRAVFDAELSRGVVRPAGSASRWGALVATVVVLLLVWAGAKVLLSGDPAPAGTGQHPKGVSHAGGGAGAHAPAITDPAIGSAVPPGRPPVTAHLSATGGSSRVVVRDASMKVVYRGTLQQGQSRRVSGRGPLRVMAADAGSITLSGPGHPAAPMGLPGQRAFRQVAR